MHVELLRGDAVVIARVNNVSRGGAFLLHPDDDVALGERVRVHLSVGDVDAVQDAKIVRISTAAPRGFAVTWLEPHAQTVVAIEQLMRGEARTGGEPKARPEPGAPTEPTSHQP